MIIVEVIGCSPLSIEEGKGIFRTIKLLILMQMIHWILLQQTKHLSLFILILDS